MFFGVESDARIAQEEVSGPVLTVVKTNSLEDTLDLTSDADYRLSANIVTQGLNKSKHFVDEIGAGAAEINEKTTGLELHVSLDGYEDLPTNAYREQDDAGLNFFSSVKTIHENY